MVAYNAVYFDCTYNIYCMYFDCTYNIYSMYVFYCNTATLMYN